MANFMITWNDAGDIVRTDNFRLPSPQWASIKGDMLGNVNDACFDKFSTYFQGSGARALGVYCVTTDEDTLRIYYCEDALASVPVWALQETYTMDDDTVQTSARIVADDEVEGFVVAGWHTQSGVYVVRTSDGGATWSSSPIHIGDAYSDTDHDDLPLGLDIRNGVQLVSGLGSAIVSSLYRSSSTSGVFSKLTENIALGPIPLVAIANEENVFITYRSVHTLYYRNGMGHSTNSGVTISTTASDGANIPYPFEASFASELVDVFLRIEFNLGKPYTITQVRATTHGYDGWSTMDTKIELRTLQNVLISSDHHLDGFSGPDSFGSISYSTEQNNVGIVVCELSGAHEG
ncbi:MAG: hypothetical protein ABI970_21075, partial [Chloroflexota bacterium]